MSIETCITIIAEEAGVSRAELDDDTEFADLGIDHILSQVIADRIAKETPYRLPRFVFDEFPNVTSFVQRLSQEEQSNNHELPPKPAPCKAAANAAAPRRVNGNTTKKNKKAPSLLLPLQGNAATASKTVFLLPDGGGAGLAYARLPRLGTDICLYGVNSPMLGVADFSTTIEEMAATFTAAIREAQPHGPYILGGWSAGGYFSTEVARQLLRAGEAVDAIILIDSPCRLEYESLPLEVVQYLAPRNLMGNWGNKDTPKWLVDHFRGTLAAVAKYKPAAVEGHMPLLFVMEAADGVFGTTEELIDTGLDQSNMLTRHLLGPRPKQFEPHGWNKLYPGAELLWARSSGSHFTMVHPPNVSCWRPPFSFFSVYTFMPIITDIMIDRVAGRLASRSIGKVGRGPWPEMGEMDQHKSMTIDALFLG